MYTKIKNPNHPAVSQYLHAAHHVFSVILFDADINVKQPLDEPQEEIFARAVLNFIHAVVPILAQPSYPLVVEIPNVGYPLRCTLMQQYSVGTNQNRSITLLVEGPDGMVCYRRMRGLDTIDMIDALVQLENPQCLDNQGYSPVPPQSINPDMGPVRYTDCSTEHRGVPSYPPGGTYINGYGQRLANDPTRFNPGSDMMYGASTGTSPAQLEYQYVINEHIHVLKYTYSSVMLVAMSYILSDTFTQYLPGIKHANGMVVLLGDEENNPETFIYIDIARDDEVANELIRSTGHMELTDGYRYYLETRYQVSISTLNPDSIDGSIELTDILLQGNYSVAPKYFWKITATE